MSDKEEFELLKKTFDEFIHTAGNLQQSYTTLKERADRLSLYLSTLLENMDAAILVFNAQSELLIWNPPAARFFPSLRRLPPPVPLKDLAEGSPIPVARIGAGDGPLGPLEVEWQGKRCWIEVSVSPFRDPSGGNPGSLWTLTDKTQLRQLQLRAEQEDRLRRMGEFAAEVAHEIRNPLASIELMTGLIEEDIAAGHSPGELIGRIRSAVRAMNHTVTNILLYTRNLHVAPAEFSLDELIDQSVAGIDEVVRKKRLQIVRDRPVTRVCADFDLLNQGLLNLLLNAAQAAPEEGTVEVRARVTDRELHLSVRDDGPGIPEGIRDQVFLPFFTTKTTGTGLGLAMVKRAIEAHGGTIGFDSPAGGGTSFHIRIPL